MVEITAPRLESPSVVPNRTHFAAKDIGRYIRAVEQNINDSLSDDEILKTCCEKFQSLCFSEVLSPLNSIMDQDVHDIRAIYTSIIVATIVSGVRYNNILIVLLYLVVRETKCPVPLTVDDMKRLTVLSKSVVDNPVLAKCLKAVFRNAVPVLRKTRMYIDHSGFSGLRDNLKEHEAKSLANGAETGRSVTVVTVGDTDVGIVNSMTGEIVFQLTAQTGHNPTLRKECGQVISELENIIRPPEAAGSLEDVALLPSKEVRRLLKTGRKK